MSKVTNDNGVMLACESFAKFNHAALVCSLAIGSNHHLMRNEELIEIINLLGELTMNALDIQTRFENDK